MPAAMGSFTLTPLPYNPYVTNISPVQSTASITIGAPVDSLNNFSYQLIPGITDVKVDMIAYASVTGQYNNIDISLINLGSVVTEGTLTIHTDPIVSIYGASPVGTEVGNNTVEWSFNNMAIGEIRHYVLTVLVNTGAVPGTPLTHTAEAATNATDVDPSNNSAIVDALAVAPFDRNDKTVEPAHASPSEVAAGKDLTYTIRFQNTGNYHASTVVITDTLSELLDPVSMRFISSSHTCSWSVLQGVLVFRFHPIFLPDSASDPLGSQGYVRFKMRTVPALQLGDQIANTANIFFDYNEPVLTAPAVFQVEEATSIKDVKQDVGVLVAPNPTNGRIMVSLTGPWERDVTLSVIDLVGRKVSYNLQGSSSRMLDLSGYAAGLLTIEVTDGHRQRISRVAKF